MHTEGTDFLVETVLSSGKYRDDVEAARAAGFRLGMVFVSLYPPELSPLRVGERVLKGGHDVRAETAIARYHRAHQEFCWFAPRTDQVHVFDNSAPEGAPKLVFFMERGVGGGVVNRYFLAGVNPEIDRMVGVAFGDE